MKKYLVFDITNLLYRTFFAHKGEDDITIAGLASHSALLTLNKYYRDYKPNKVVMCFDRTSWRKEFTVSEQSITKKPYKGNRRQNMTPAEKIKYQLFLNHLSDFETMMRDHTSVITLAGDKLEADDLVAGFIQVTTLNEDDCEIVVISGDKDMIQLLGFPRVRVVDPATGKDRTLEEWNDDAEYFLFEKCIRGDLGDNVMSALPRVRSTRIKKAYEDEFERINMMKETWKLGDQEYVVGDVFKENQLLMDLRRQPDDIQRQIVQTVLHGVSNPGSFSYFHFMKFLGKYELKKVAEQAETFVPLLSR